MFEVLQKHCLSAPGTVPYFVGRVTQYDFAHSSQHWWQFGAVGSDVGMINEATLRGAQLVLGWVTVSGFNSCCEKFISV